MAQKKPAGVAAENTIVRRLMFLLLALDGVLLKVKAPVTVVTGDDVSLALVGAAGVFDSVAKTSKQLGCAGFYFSAADEGGFDFS